MSVCGRTGSGSSTPQNRPASGLPSVNSDQQLTHTEESDCRSHVDLQGIWDALAPQHGLNCELSVCIHCCECGMYAGSSQLVTCHRARQRRHCQQSRVLVHTAKHTNDLQDCRPAGLVEDMQHLSCTAQDRPVRNMIGIPILETQRRRKRATNLW